MTGSETGVRIRGMHAAVEHDGRPDVVAVEEPLEIRVDGAALAVTMRTPGDDEHLAAGFLFGEGLIDRWPRIGPPADLAANAVDVRGPLRRDPGVRRFYTTSSCGVCGKGALEQVASGSGTYLLVGRTYGGRLLTIPIVETALSGRWRPISAWDASTAEATRYRNR